MGERKEAVHEVTVERSEAVHEVTAERSEHSWEYSNPKKPRITVTLKNSRGKQVKKTLLVDSGYTGDVQIEPENFEKLSKDDGLGHIRTVVSHCAFCVCDRCRPELSDAERDRSQGLPLPTKAGGHTPVTGKQGTGWIVILELGINKKVTIATNPIAKNAIGKGFKNKLDKNGWELNDTVVKDGKYHLVIKKKLE